MAVEYSFFGYDVGRNGYCLALGNQFGKKLIIESAIRGSTMEEIVSDSIRKYLKIENNNEIGVLIIDAEYCFITVTDNTSKMIKKRMEDINFALKTQYGELSLIGYHLLSYLGVEMDIPFDSINNGVQE